MNKNYKTSPNQYILDNYFEILCDTSQKFYYTGNIVSLKDKNKISSNKAKLPQSPSPKKINSTTANIKSPQKFNNKNKSIFDGLLGHKKLSVENTEKQLIKDEIKAKKKHKNITNGFHDNYFNEFLEINEEEMRKKIEEEEEKQKNHNIILQRNLMGNKGRKLMTQNKENEERRQKEEEMKKNLLNMNMSIPYINPIRHNNLDKYKSFHPLINDIYKNVLDFNFYNTDHPTEEIPNTFVKRSTL